MSFEVGIRRALDNGGNRLEAWGAKWALWRKVFASVEGVDLALIHFTSSSAVFWADLERETLKRICIMYRLHVS